MSIASGSRAVVWHDLECGAYAEDLELWRELAGECDGPVLDVGAGTGRVAIDLARRGHRVIALDRDGELLSALAERARELPVEPVRADACEFSLGQEVGLCLVPMQTVQLLGREERRAQFLSCAREHLRAGGRLAVAITSALEEELYETAEGLPSPLPDICELDGVVYCSQPTAVRLSEAGYVLERRREVILPDGRRELSEDRVVLHRLGADQLEREAENAGFYPFGRRQIPATREYAGSEVVLLRA